jgi:hypothetical protein
MGFPRLGQAMGDLVDMGRVAEGGGQVDDPALFFEGRQGADGGALAYAGLDFVKDGGEFLHILMIFD